MIIERAVSDSIRRLIKKYPLIAVTGPRQSGKTTLLRHLFPDYQYVSMEHPDNLSFALEDPNGFLATYDNPTIFDEIQRAPEIFSYLQTKTDKEKIMGQYILSGSQNFLLKSGITHSLAGRVPLFKLLPLSFSELQAENLLSDTPNRTIFSGFYPATYDRKIAPNDFYPSYVETYLERDVQGIINASNLHQFQMFMRLCAGYSGQLLNFSALAEACEISSPTAKFWLSILEKSYIVFILRPYHKNFKKRLVKSPKLYFYDTGLACYLLGIRNAETLTTYYQQGNLFENLIIAELYKSQFNQGLRAEYSFWRDSNQIEMDLVWEKDLKLQAMEIKSGMTIHSRHFSGIKKFKEIANQECQSHLVYGGEENSTRHETQVYGWKNMPF